MSGKMERIPIISLSGCRSLTDVLTELPIPQPSHLTIDCRTLLYEPKLVHDAYRCINTEDSILIQRLCSALNNVPVDHVSFKDISVDSRDGNKVTSPPSLLCALEKSGAFLRPPATEPLIETDASHRILKELTEPLAIQDTAKSVDVEQDQTPLKDLPPTTCDEKSSDSYSAVHIAPLRIALKKCMSSKDSPTKKGKKSRRKQETVPENKPSVYDGNQESQNHSSSGERLKSEGVQVQLPVLKISTGGTPTSCTTDMGSLLNVVNSDSISLSGQNLPNPPLTSIPPVRLVVEEKQTATVASTNSSNDQSEITCGKLISNSQEPLGGCYTSVSSPSLISVTTVSSINAAVTTTVSHPVGQSVTPTFLNTSASVVGSSTNASPASSAPHSVNPENTPSSRRFPDSTLSQNFPSAALFHIYQPNIDSEKSGSCTGGGLFDDWIDTSGKTSEPSLFYPISDGMYSGSLSGPSSVMNVPSNCSQAPHSVGASADVSVCAPRTPLSVPSNHSSYPATPGGGLPTVVLSVSTAVNAISASPSTLSKCIYPPSGVHSPSVRLFNTSESGADSHEPAVEEENRIAPLGLAAYLPRSDGLRPSFPDAEEDYLLGETGHTHSPRATLSLDAFGPRSCGTTEFGSKLHSTSKQGKSSSHVNASPTKSSGRGRFSSGKPRGGGGRRRRTELEELKMWSVNDRAQALSEKKGSNTPDSFDITPQESKETSSNTAPALLSSSAPITACKVTEHLTNNQLEASDSNHGGFTEALVERVKRRRQQREMELNQRRSGIADSHAYRSSDASPASTPSPVRSVGPDGDSSSRTKKAHDFNRLKNGLTDGQRSTHNAELAQRSHTKQMRQKSYDSDASLSPFSTIASSVPSSKPSSVSSCVDGVPPPPLDNAKSHSIYSALTERLDPLKSTIFDLNEPNALLRSDERFLSTAVTPTKNPTSHSSTQRSIGKDQIHDHSSVESHFSSPSRTLLSDKASHSSSLSPNNNRIQGSDAAFIDDVSQEHHTKQSRHIGPRVHSPLVNKTDAHMRRRRRVIISDDEEIGPSNYNKESTYVHESPPPPRRLEKFEPQMVQSQSTKTSKPPEELLPPFLQPSNDAPNKTADSVDHRATRIPYNTSPSDQQFHDRRDPVRVHSSRMVMDNLPDKVVPHICPTENLDCTTGLNGSTASIGVACTSKLPSSRQGGIKRDSQIPSTGNQSSGVEVPFSSDEDTTVLSKNVIRSTHRSPSNDSMVSLTSSAQLASTYGSGFLPDVGCPTPSTIAYTHSSAMDESDSRGSDVDSLPHASGQHREADSGVASPNASSQSIPDAEESDLSDESFSQEKQSTCSSPSSLSAQSEDDRQGSADDSDEARHQSEELTEAAAALAQFTARLSKILRRVEELDLLCLASKVNERRRPRSGYFTHSGTEAEPDTSFDEHLIPDAARLTRHELSALYSESAHVRLTGSMFTIPTGRLVRFLTLLLVNMQSGAHMTPAPVTQAEVDHFLRKRQKVEAQHRDGSRRLHQSQQLTESILWTNPMWACVLTALDCARIALNIIVAPDMPRPLLMEDLVDGIVSVVRCQLEGVVCKPSNNGRTTNHQLGFSEKQLWNFACECVGFRTSQLMAMLGSLIRFQPNRFTDNLVIKLTEVGLTVPLYCLTSGQSMERDPKRLTIPILRKLLHSSLSALFTQNEHKTNSVTSFPMGPSRLWLYVWPDRLQRTSLALLAGLYGQYEAHRKLIVDEIFRSLLSHCVVVSGGNPDQGEEDTSLTVNTTSSDKRAARTFRFLSTVWLYKQRQRYKQINRISSTTTTTGTGEAHDMGTTTDESRGSQPQFIHVHALTALFLSLTQGLIQSPGSINSSSTSGVPSGVSRKGVSTPGSGDQNSLDNNQFLKDEKQVLSSYHVCLRHAHHLLSGLLKRVCTRAELDLRPVLDTVTFDLIAVSTAAPLEWPVAPTLLCVLGGLLIQHLSQNCGSNNSTNASVNANPTPNSRTSELSSKLVCLDTLTTLAIGLKRSSVLSLEHRSSLRRSDAGSGVIPSSRDASRSTSNETEDSLANEANIRRQELIAQAQVIGFNSSPVPILNIWLLQPGLDNSSDGVFPLNAWKHQERDCMKAIRLEYMDYLFVTSQRFFLASWLHSCTRDLREVLSHANNRRSGVETSSASSSKSASKRVRELEQLRHQLLSELALTHHLPSSSLPWLSGSKHSGSLVGSSSLSSPSSNRPSRQNSTSHCPGSGLRASSGSTPSRTLVYGGSFLSHEIPAKWFVEYAHARHMDRKLRLRLSTHAHWSAWQLLSLHPVVPGFEKLFGAICRLVGESSVPVRTKALRSLAAVIEIDPKLFLCSAIKNPEKQSQNQVAWVRDLPRLVHARLLDNSASVREAAVDLVSKLLVLRPRALPEYYPMLAERVLDKGVSVRKRAIRCFRDLLVVDWNGNSVGAGSANPNRVRSRGKQKFILMTNQLGVEMCIKLIRRLHDEDSIQKLVVELFHSLWFTPIPETNVHCQKLLDRRILSLSSVTQTLRSSNFEVLESFLKQILTTNDSVKFELLDTACVQLVNRLIILVKRISAPFLSNQRHSERSRPSQVSDSSLPVPSLQGLLASMHLLSRCKPELFYVHCEYLVNLLRKAPLAPLTPTSNAVVASSTNSPASSQLANDTLLGLDPQCLYHLLNTIEMTLISLALNPNQKNISEHISTHRLNDLQLDLVRLIQRQGRLVVDSALSCLATLTNRVLKDHTQVVVCFAQFYGLLTNLSFDLRQALSTRGNSPPPISSRTRPSILRALYTVGSMCKHFVLDDLLSEDKRMSTKSEKFLDEILDTLILFAEYASALSATDGNTANQQTNDADLCRKAIMGIGFLVNRHDRLLCDKRLSAFFSRFFTCDTLSTSCSTTSAGTIGSSKLFSTSFHEVQCIILDNLTHYLMDSERQMVADSRSWSSHHKSESLKELADQRSGHGSAVAQEYLPLVLNHCILTRSLTVRTSALGLLSVILRQGLVHPVQTLSYLICLQTDPDSGNRSRATHLLAEAERKVPGFTAMRAAFGVQLSYQLHLLLSSSISHQNTNSSTTALIRGAVQDNPNTASDSGFSTLPVALNHAIYSLLRPNRQSRRSFISSLLALFDSDQNKQFFNNEVTHSSNHTSFESSLGQLVFVADQLAHFPYSVLDEVLFIAYHIEQRLSVSGSSLTRLIQHTLLSSLLRTESDTHRARKDGTVDTSQAEVRLMNLIEAAEIKVLKCERFTEQQAEVVINAEWDQGGKLHALFEQAHFSNAKARQAMISHGPVCWLLLALRQHLRDVYGVTDSKLKDYSPSDSVKQWERPIILPKRTSGGNHLLRVPALVIQCLNNPGWSKCAPSPPDTVVLYQFIQLRHRLLALEDSSPTVGFSSPTPVLELPSTSNVSFEEDRNEIPTGAENSNVETTVCGSEVQSPDPKESTKKLTNSPGCSLPNENDPTNHRARGSSCSDNERSRNREAHKTFSAVSLSASTTKSEAPATTKVNQRHAEKSHTCKRRPRSSSISSLSSSLSSDVTSPVSQNRSRPVNRHSIGDARSEAPHTPAKQSRVKTKDNFQLANRLSGSTKTHPNPRAPGTTPPGTSLSHACNSSKRSLEQSATHPGKRTSKHSAPVSSVSLSSTDLESSNSDTSGPENEPIQPRQTASKAINKTLTEHGSFSRRSSLKRPAKSHPNTRDLHTEPTRAAGSLRQGLTDEFTKGTSVQKRGQPSKNDSQESKSRHEPKFDLSVSQGAIPPKASDKSVLKLNRSSVSQSTVRSLAPLPQAMMQGSHVHAHRTTVHNPSQKAHRKSAGALRISNGSTPQPFTAKPSSSETRGDQSSSRSHSVNLDVTKARVNTPSTDRIKPSVERDSRKRSSQAFTKKKPPRVISRLSDSSSPSSHSDGSLAPIPSSSLERAKKADTHSKLNTTGKSSNGTRIASPATTRPANVSVNSGNPMRRRRRASMSSVSSSSSSDVSSSSSSSTSSSSSSSTSTTSTSDSSDRSMVTKPSKQPRLSR
ncbi:hypothetical protein FGIG_01028 [Fasciola gigantica]|uniref:Nipped-B protein n=1 Tax=Fasciola gigantica TaxID=46835 RepID=A0A504YV62_FASGI|nr:hypothetical protein FGIG_01028 [Fasciola gigantica]